PAHAPTVSGPSGRGRRMLTFVPVGAWALRDPVRAGEIRARPTTAAPPLGPSRRAGSSGRPQPRIPHTEEPLQAPDGFRPVPLAPGSRIPETCMSLREY